MFEYLSIKDNLNKNAHKISMMKYRQNIKTHPVAFSVEVHVINENNIKPKQLASSFDIFSLAGYQVNDIRAKNPAMKILPKIPKKVGIAPISPKIAIPKAIAIDCIDNIPSPVLAYLYIKLNPNHIKPITDFTIRGLVLAMSVVASSGIAKDDTKEPTKRNSGKIILLFFKITPIMPIIIAEIKGISSSSNVKTVKKSLLSYVVKYKTAEITNRGTIKGKNREKLELLLLLKRPLFFAIKLYVTAGIRKFIKAAINTIKKVPFIDGSPCFYNSFPNINI